MSRSHWLMAAALAIFIAGPAMSQQPVIDPSQADARIIHNQASPIIHDEPLPVTGFEIQQDGPNITVRHAGGPNVRYSTALIADPVPSKYWLGIYCSPVPPALRAHLTLPEKQGLLAVSIAKDSPAAKAGIAQYDILLRAGGKPLTDPRDLLTAVEAAKETKLKIDLIRGGKPRTIEATPAKRPAPTAGTSIQVPEQADWNTIDGWLQHVMPGQSWNSPNPPQQFRLFQPGAIVPNNTLAPKPLPTNMSVSITKGGNEPAKIKVQRGNDKWELTEKGLDKLPADVRPFVDQMLGRGMMGIVGGPAPPMAPGGTLRLPPPSGIQPQPFPGRLDQQIMEKRFDEINRRMDQLFKMMEQLSEGHGEHAVPERHEAK